MLSVKKLLSSYWPYLLLISVVLVTYLGFIHNDFVSDDIPAFVNATNIQTRTGLTFLQKINIQNFLYHLSYKYFDLSPVPLHLFSLFMHMFNVLVLYGFSRKLFSEKIALSTSVLFAVHPLNSEAVLWISANNYLVSFLFYILIADTFLMSKTIKQLVLPLSIYILTLIFTQNVWMLLVPFILWFVSLISGERSLKVIFYRVLPFILVSIIAFLVLFRSLYIGRSEYIYQVSENMDSRILKYTLPYSIGSTAKLLVYPQNLTLYHEGEFALPSFVMTSRIILVLVIALGVYLFVKQRKLFYVYAMVFVSILPSLSPVRVANFFAERYVYFGSAFFCILVSSLFLYIAKKAKSQDAFYVLIFVLALVYSSRTLVRGAEWKNPIVFWEATTRESPNSAGAFNNLGIEYVKANRFEEALVQFQKSVKINPRVPDAQYNIGRILLVAGRYDIAEPYLLNALKLSPNEPKIIDAVNQLNAKKQGL